MAFEEATQNCLRLNDEKALDSYDVFQEYPHSPKWRYIHKAQLESSRQVSQRQKNAFFLILDINLPMLQLNIQTEKSENQALLYVNQNCTVSTLKYLLRNQMNLKESLENVHITYEKEQMFESNK